MCKVVPNDKDAKKKLEECEKIVKRIAFEEAINSEEEKVVVSDTIDLNNFAVDAAHDGPKIPEDGQITLEFVMAMIERFRNQKTIHKKYFFQVNFLILLPGLRDNPNSLPLLDADPGPQVVLDHGAHG